MAVATRHLEWRLVEVIREIPGLGYGAAAQGIRWFWMQLPQHSEKRKFLGALISEMSKIKIRPLCPIVEIPRPNDKISN